MAKPRLEGRLLLPDGARQLPAGRRVQAGAHRGTRPARCRVAHGPARASGEARQGRKNGDGPHVDQRQQPSMMSWWRDAPPDARRALAAAMFGWMLDAFDVMLFALVLPYVRADLGLTSAQG